MTKGDIPLGMRLKAQAGWNQLEADWNRALELEPAGCFVAEVAGRPSGTTTVCRFGSIAWIAMVLVDEAARGRGIGGRLLQHALDTLDGSGIASIRLDATDLGRPLYEKLGFVPEYQLVRYAGQLAPGSGRAPAATPRITDERFDSLVELDKLTTGTPRRRLLERLRWEASDAFCWIGEGQRCTAYATARAGDHAMQLGPSAAADGASMRELLATVARRWSGQQIYIDVPLDNRLAIGWADAIGLKPERHFTRMVRGTSVKDRPELCVATSGPEKG